MSQMMACPANTELLGRTGRETCILSFQGSEVFRKEGVWWSRTRSKFWEDNAVRKADGLKPCRNQWGRSIQFMGTLVHWLYRKHKVFFENILGIE